MFRARLSEGALSHVAQCVSALPVLRHEQLESRKILRVRPLAFEYRWVSAVMAPCETSRRRRAQAARDARKRLNSHLGICVHVSRYSLAYSMYSTNNYTLLYKI